ncbi:uncharacterized protein Z519_00406 [Cladophialophora bantiana CBS 173.52]|uniref:Transcription factor domain-containing protein n=1 Tax=Cladophialophora bantiana (strain ATCC 10958 / CBS 173.52 / CDC B-1940 / NIH 8579) TaxID=1442370 RepID=A0A0D2HZ41_CLAB1|nr:uncharacterized protein Z519_00406 [Cladophialophora bantiana CBS 173.52]KIW98743.1 hypothetical protein Z519_00406 [Cladophialophora bantiana CBS 173.52]
MAASTTVPDKPYQNSTTESHPRLYRPGQWPGERRHPTRWDVHDAIDSPAATFLERFRIALLHSEGAAEDVLLDPESVINASEPVVADMTSAYAYPVVMLSDIPTLPPEETLARLEASFFDSFEQHVFLNSVRILNWCSGRQPLYFQVALACLGSITSTSSISDIVASGTSRAELSAGLFIAGVNIWIVMLEVDNRESRLCEAVITAALLCTYGTLSADSKHRENVSGILCNLATMSRRTHLIDGYSPVYASTQLPEKAFGIKSSLVGYLILVDTMHAVHCQSMPNFSTSELYIRMPTSNHHFRAVYNSMIHGYALPADAKSCEDALLLLVALLSDIIYMQHCHCSAPGYHEGEVTGVPLRNPFIPLSVQGERCRLTADMSAALSRWERHFKHQIGKDILALYYFAHLRLTCLGLGDLNYAAMSGCNSSSFKSIEIPDKALDLAWLILEQCHRLREDQRLAIWLPIVLFQSALVVWQKLKSPTPHRKYGTLRVLNAFSNEISKLPWSCCGEMTETLDKLAES